MSTPTTGQAPFTFVHRPDLHTLPTAVGAFEIDLHGGFAVDERPDFGHVYYGMPGAGILRIDPDLQRQELITLPDELTPLNFHSTKIGQFDGQQRLILPANDNEMVAIVTFEGAVDFVLPRPAYDAYLDAETPYKPTDVLLVDETLYVADGYGSNFISTANINSRQWTGGFGGVTKDPTVHGKFGTAHGITLEPLAQRLAIADRWNGRIEHHHHDGSFVASYGLPAGTWPCGIRYIQQDGRWLGIVGCLYDDVNALEKPAPIYILDGESHAILSKVQPKVDLGIENAQRIHNAIGYQYNGEFFLICQAWNPGHFFILQLV